MQFSYTATDPSGRQVTGTVEAKDRQEVVRELLRRNYRVDRVDAVPSPRRAPIHHRIFFRVRSRVLALFFDSMGRSLRAGLSAGMALYSLAEHAEHPFIRRVCADMAPAVEHGSPLSQEMLKRPTIFPPLFVEMVRVGEQAGSLDNMCVLAAEYLDFMDQLEGLIRRGLLYPLVVLFIGLIAISVVSSAHALVAGDVTTFVRAVLLNFARVVLPYVSLVVVFRVLSAYEWFRRGFDRLKMSIPWIGSICSRLAYARFSRALMTLFSAGVPMVGALELSGAASANRVVQKRIARAIPLVKQGASLSEALSREAHIPGMVRQMIAVGEQSGQLGESLSSVAEYYERDAAAGMRTLGTLTGIAVYLFVLIYFAVVVINFWVGYYSNLFEGIEP